MCLKWLEASVAPAGQKQLKFEAFLVPGSSQAFRVYPCAQNGRGEQIEERRREYTITSCICLELVAD